MKTSKSLLYFFALMSLSALLSFSGPSASAQCAMCKAVAKSNVDSKQNGVGLGINHGVMYLMLTPYLLVAAGIFYIYKKKKKADATLPV